MNTYGDTAWVLNEPKTLPPVTNPQLCTNQVLHAYTCPILALLLNPIHADIINPRLFEAEGEIVIADWDKCGTFNLTLTNELSLPEWWSDKDKRKKVQISFAILCAKAVLPIFENQFLSDTRPRQAIEAAENYLLNHSSRDAADAAYAAYAAADAAYAAARAAARLS